MSAEHLFDLFEKRSLIDESEALGSYWRYHNICKTVADRYGVEVYVAAGVFSALSPNNEYVGNVRDLVTVLDAVSRQRDIDSFKVKTYGNNKRKAWQIATGVHPDTAIKALKTHNFYHNILNPDNPDYVTVDGHMYWAWRGTVGNVTGKRKKGIGAKVKGEGANVPPRVYREIAGDITGLAKALKIIPCQLQAILWITYKRVHSKAYPKQIEFFPSDHVAAGIFDLGKKAL